jgi:PAS domain S-box-containing protein
VSGSDLKLNLHDPPLEDPRVIIDAIGVPVTRCSRDLRYVWVNAPFAHWLGISRDQIVGRPISDVIGQSALETFRPFFESALSGEKVEYEGKVLYKGIGERWIRAIYTPTFGPNEIPDGWVAVVIDVDNEHRAQDRLEEYNALLVRLHESASLFAREDGLEQALQILLEGVIDATHADFGNVQLVDPQTGALKIIAQRGFGAEFLEFFSAADGDLGACGDAKKSKSRVIVENVADDPIFAEVSTKGVMERAGVAAVQSTPLFGRSGEFLGIVSTHFRARHRPENAELQIVDIFARQTADLIEYHRTQAEQNRAQETLRSAARAKDEFLAILGHELRNPLTPITLALQGLKRRGNDREHQIIERQVRHLTTLVDDLLDVERLVRGKVKLDRDNVEVAAVIASAVETAAPAIEGKWQHLSVEVPAVGLVIDGDAERLRQVFANLLSNAAKYTQAAGHIRISAYRDGSEVVVEVSDNGKGIGPDLLPHVFEMFTQGYRAADRAEGGLGLGLALVKNLVELHGGSVVAESDGERKGSRFRVRLPVSLKMVTFDGSASKPLLTKTGRPLRVLVVEDNDDIRDILAEALRSAGHHVETAADGPAALALLTTFFPEVALLDIGLPVMNGYELAKEIASRSGARAPTMIALSGYGQSTDHQRSRDAGFYSYLVKPFDLKVLLETLTMLSE